MGSVGFSKIPWIIKLSNWEYWPNWVVYIPVVFQHFFLAVKARNLFFFVNTNPTINGFILSDSKYQTLQLVPETLRPKGFLLKPGTTAEILKSKIKDSKLVFPLILKPDIGFRGILVKKILSEGDFIKLLPALKVKYLVQEFIDYPVEVGVFYYRLPNSKNGVIPSITQKEFLQLEGNGVNTVKELVFARPRAILQAPRLEKKFAADWNRILEKGEKIKLEEIGNHNLGTKFIDASDLNDARLQKVFDNLSFHMPGFYLGRFDIKATSVEDLKESQNFKILEVNGVGGEPTHIYDSNYPLFRAWLDMLKLWRVTCTIAIENQKKGYRVSAREAVKRWNDFRVYKKKAFRK